LHLSKDQDPPLFYQRVETCGLSSTCTAWDTKSAAGRRRLSLE